MFDGLRGSLVTNGDFELELAVVMKKKWYGNGGFGKSKAIIFWGQVLSWYTAWAKSYGGLAV